MLEPGCCILYARTRLLHIGTTGSLHTCNGPNFILCNNRVVAYNMQRPGCCIRYATTQSLLYATTRSLHISNDRVVAYCMQRPGCCIRNSVCNNPVVAYRSYTNVAYMQRPGCCISYATTQSLHTCMGGLHITPMMN